uniref:Uncharacterized protein n=1 Tax=Romanomermis culicivorax TaxID=13658 RepID=A0A915HMG8_ROMCU
MHILHHNSYVITYVLASDGSEIPIESKLTTGAGRHRKDEHTGTQKFENFPGATRLNKKLYFPFKTHMMHFRHLKNLINQQGAVILANQKRANASSLTL